MVIRPHKKCSPKFLLKIIDTAVGLCDNSNVSQLNPVMILI